MILDIGSNAVSEAEDVGCGNDAMRGERSFVEMLVVHMHMHACMHAKHDAARLISSGLL
jgi:hypothetical protein